MLKKLGNLGDRLLTRLVPKVVASAGTQGCTGIYCGCIAGYDSYRLTNESSCSKCRSSIC
ncbi:hypothetical protein JOF56_007968 [Kibdelosporangium banguiense]|uniref:Uncharacterized protein n=1 Tax=Kibdelosporangium banguiense TaxID=1365924 RepID=A0ABS4TT75_9PSEU|nr:hypothetical protein [Kibdelosporangium banguiense]MBP2327583.1 hypothetical protein [Kibdelosporangium banguiense]